MRLFNATKYKLYPIILTIFIRKYYFEIIFPNKSLIKNTNLYMRTSVKISNVPYLK